NVTITKPGFGLDRVYGVAVAGPGTNFIPQVDLGEIPAVGPHIVSASIVNATIQVGFDSVLGADSLGDSVHHSVPHYEQQQQLQIHRIIPLDVNYHGICIFIDKDSSKQPGDVHWLSSIDGVGPISWSGIWYDTAIVCPVSALHTAGISSGTTIYLSLAQFDPYPINGAENYNHAYYYDPVHNQNRLISPSPRSNVIAITIP
ncbi:MAG TPA: hypothetical protein VG537_10345, partial [Candidatus Kapabacteria bacterium]|nr:hypothetical protein [Candidatus Kapabacteria bacterium]